MNRLDVTFNSAGTDCAAWLYRPDGEGPHPLVVMAHGFSATRELRLDAYAERFCAAGLGALVFDYRHFGASARRAAPAAVDPAPARRLPRRDRARARARLGRPESRGGVRDARSPAGT